MTVKEGYNGLRYDMAANIVDGPSKSDLTESLSVGSPSRGIERPFIEISYMVGDQVAAIRAEVDGLTRLRGEPDEWEIRGHTISQLIVDPEHPFIAIYNCRTRKGKLVLQDWREIKLHLTQLAAMPTI